MFWLPGAEGLQQGAGWKRGRRHRPPGRAAAAPGWEQQLETHLELPRMAAEFCAQAGRPGKCCPSVTEGWLSLTGPGARGAASGRHQCGSSKATVKVAEPRTPESPAVTLGKVAGQAGPRETGRGTEGEDGRALRKWRQHGHRPGTGGGRGRLSALGTEETRGVHRGHQGHAQPQVCSLSGAGTHF